MTGKTYERYVKARAKKSNTVKDCFAAFVSGGLICTAGEGLRQLYRNLGLTINSAGTLTSVTLIFITAIVTGLGFFDKIAKHCGGGTLVPITGFANAVTSAAIDNKSEGYILGVGAKIFSIAGPVILYGITAGVAYGIIYWLIGLFM